ncbi:hypothetical protein HNO88_003224 [Novosphingobium chloroacetimidivorans]|uniref:DUF4440 domain-containing protein n=1 Tax=Novosphingobium chloroacetimidivorans TaxID=1428314 RepID=A0A7W7KCG2_9SPHN|nr:nuclear transport factor 2 family protein [Novosphingobium chloroacetimidivorans]MBB4859891.1 hypothetical protein [Novosphingobium chloroacetimidivorans]
MHLRTALLPLALAAGALAGPAWADSKSDFQARYDQLEKAMETREPEQVQPLVTPDYSVTDIGGRKQDLEGMLDRLSMIPVDPERREKVTIDSVELHGDTAEVLKHRERSGTREGPDGKEHTMSFVVASRDAWVQSPKGWLLKSSEAQTMTITRDGQVVRQMKQGDPMPLRGMRRGGRGPGGDGMTPPPGGPPPASDGD